MADSLVRNNDRQDHVSRRFLLPLPVLPNVIRSTYPTMTLGLASSRDCIPRQPENALPTFWERDSVG